MSFVFKMISTWNKIKMSGKRHFSSLSTPFCCAIMVGSLICSSSGYFVDAAMSAAAMYAAAVSAITNRPSLTRHRRRRKVETNLRRWKGLGHGPLIARTDNLTKCGKQWQNGRPPGGAIRKFGWKKKSSDCTWIERNGRAAEVVETLAVNGETHTKVKLDEERQTENGAVTPFWLLCVTGAFKFFWRFLWRRDVSWKTEEWPNESEKTMGCVADDPLPLIGHKWNKIGNRKRSFWGPFVNDQAHYRTFVLVQWTNVWNIFLESIGWPPTTTAVFWRKCQSSRVLLPVQWSLESSQWPQKVVDVAG